jgi:phosphoenolpyruvate synthase/pyruvate phosphate dikinase
MSALIQIGINNDRSGVLITKDPFDPLAKNSVYISAVCGLGESVANNKGIPEQVIFNPRSNAVVLMTYSDLENAMKFDEAGYLKEVPDKCANPSTKRILSDAQTRELARIGIRIRMLFGNKAEQDIEWGIMNGKFYIVQARPYIEK